MCRDCQALQVIQNSQSRHHQAEGTGNVLMCNPQCERRNIRRTRHYDSFPEMDQPRNCERATRDPNHPPTYLRDFIDEIDGRQRAVCNACRRQLQEPNDSIVPIHRLRDNGYLFECIC